MNNRIIFSLSLFIYLLAFYSNMFCQTPSKTNDMDQLICDNDLERLNNVYGYFIGQEAMLSHISNKFPLLKYQVDQCRINFNLKFGKAFENVELHLKSLLKNKIDEYKSSLGNQLMDLIKLSEIDYNNSVLFIAEVNWRAEGNIDKNILPLILKYQFLLNPNKEIEEYHFSNFSSSQIAFNANFDLTFNYPKSWKIIKSTDKNTIVYIRSEDGQGCATVSVTYQKISENKNLVISKQDIDKYFSDENLKKSLPGNATYISSRRITVNNNPAAENVYLISKNSLNQNLKFKFSQITTVQNNYLFSFTYSVQDRENNSFDFDYDRYKNLFNYIASTITIKSK